MKLHYIILIASAISGCLCAFVDLHVNNEKMVAVIIAMVQSAVILVPMYKDSASRNIQIGAFIPALIIFIQPIGILLYSIKSRRTGFYTTVLLYLISMALFVGSLMVIEWAVLDVSKL